MDFPVLRKKKESEVSQKIQSMRDLVRDLLKENLWDWPDMRPAFLDHMRGLWVPRVDTLETDTEVKMKLSLPGVEKKDISIETDGHMITISGVSEEKKEEKSETWYMSERETGEFRRTLSLPEGVDIEHASARLASGVLEVVLPKKGESKSSKNKITIEEE